MSGYNCRYRYLRVCHCWSSWHMCHYKSCVEVRFAELSLFGRVRLRTFEVPEPTPAPDQKGRLRLLTLKLLIWALKNLFINKNYFWIILYSICVCELNWLHVYILLFLFFFHKRFSRSRRRKKQGSIFYIENYFLSTPPFGDHFFPPYIPSFARV